jgi:hypothetical protein
MELDERREARDGSDDAVDLCTTSRLGDERKSIVATQRGHHEKQVLVLQPIR